MVARGQMGYDKILKPMKNMMRFVLERVLSFVLAKVKCGRDGEGERDVPHMGSHIINI